MSAVSFLKIQNFIMLTTSSRANFQFVRTIIMASTILFNSLRSVHASKRFALPSLMLLNSQSSKFSNNSIVDGPDLVKVVNEKVVFSGYRNILRRDVILPTGKNVSYDIVHQEFPSIVVVNWDTATATCTLIKEYHPGPQVLIFVSISAQIGVILYIYVCLCEAIHVRNSSRNV